MNGPVLFPEPIDPHEGWLGWAEPQVHFYLKSTRPEAAEARQWVNSAYGRFPDTNGRFADLLRSTDDIQHISALDELFVHDQLIQLGHVVYEEDGVGPDFRVYRHGEYIGGVEVCSLFENREWEAERLRHAQIGDQLNRRIPLGNWFIHFEVIRVTRQPSINRLVAWVKARIAELPVDATATATEWITYETEEAKLRFRFLRRHADTPPKPSDRIVGIGQVGGGFVDSFLRLRSALDKKVQKRYDTRGKPFAIVVGAWDSACTIDQFEDALLGNEQVIIESGDVKRANNGFFGRSRQRPEGKHRDISCVIAVRGWKPWKQESLVTLRFDNPFADDSFPEELIPPDYRLRFERDTARIWFRWVPARPETA